MKRLMNINEFNEIDNSYNLTITAKKSFKDYNVKAIFLNNCV